MTRVRRSLSPKIPIQPRYGGGLTGKNAATYNRILNQLETDYTPQIPNEFSKTKKLLHLNERYCPLPDTPPDSPDPDGQSNDNESESNEETGSSKGSAKENTQPASTSDPKTDSTKITTEVPQVGSPPDFNEEMGSNEANVKENVQPVSTPEVVINSPEVIMGLPPFDLQPEEGDKDIQAPETPCSSNSFRFPPASSVATSNKEKRPQEKAKEPLQDNNSSPQTTLANVTFQKYPYQPYKKKHNDSPQKDNCGRLKSILKKPKRRGILISRPTPMKNDSTNLGPVTYPKPPSSTTQSQSSSRNSVPAKPNRFTFIYKILCRKSNGSGEGHPKTPKQPKVHLPNIEQLKNNPSMNENKLVPIACVPQSIVALSRLQFSPQFAKNQTAVPNKPKPNWRNPVDVKLSHPAPNPQRGVIVKANGRSSKLPPIVTNQKDKPTIPSSSIQSPIKTSLQWKKFPIIASSPQKKQNDINTVEAILSSNRSCKFNYINPKTGVRESAIIRPITVDIKRSPSLDKRAIREKQGQAFKLNRKK